MFVFRTIQFILILKCFVTTTYSETILSSTVTKTNETIANVTTNITKLNKEQALIIDEGGETLSTKVPVINVRTSLSANDTVSSTPTSIITHGREGVTVETASTKKPEQNISMTLNTTDTKLINIDNKQSNGTKSEAVKPVIEDSIIMDGNANTSRSGSVARKGVTFTSDQLNVTATSTLTTIAAEITTKTTTTTTSTTTEKPLVIITKASTIESTTIVKQIHKPTITTGSESDKDALVKVKSNNSTPKVPTIEYYQKNKEENKRSTFVIPIVAVILSVPLVAIIVNILYKHGKEWWSHRHYRRMDFLIDGMYNN